MLSDDEHLAMEMTAQLANLLYKIVCQGDDPLIVTQDWTELAHDIHHIQNTIMAQSAAREYSDLYRLLGCALPRED
jgi:hypothetical protein